MGDRVDGLLLFDGNRVDVDVGGVMKSRRKIGRKKREEICFG
jgi:hypothetical protein